MAIYQYVDKAGGLQTVEAANPAAAIASALNIAPRSGVALSQNQTTATPPPATGTTATTTVTPKVTSSLPSGVTAGSLTSGLGLSDLDKATARLTKEAKGEAEAKVDREAIRRQTLARMQAQIDATNNVYAGILGEARRQGLANIGSGTAIAARSGLLGSTFGEAQRQNIVSQNLDVERSIEAERASKVASLLGEAEKGATEEFERQRKAKQEGAQSYLTYLEGQATRKKTATNTVVARLVALGIDPSTLTTQEQQELATKLGVDINDISAEYQVANAPKALQKRVLAANGEGKDALTIARELGLTVKEVEDIVGKPAADDVLTLSEGQSIFKKDPTTGEYKLMANVPKTFAPKSSSGPGGLTPNQQFNAVQQLSKSYQANTKAAQEITRQYQNIKSALDGVTNDPNRLNAATQAIVTSYNKILDPGSVVMVSEYARSATGQALIGTVQGKLEAIVKGGPGLTAASLKEFETLASRLQKNAEAYLKLEQQRVSKVADTYGLDKTLIYSPLPTGDDAEDEIIQYGADKGFSQQEVQEVIGMYGVEQARAIIDAAASGE